MRELIDAAVRAAGQSGLRAAVVVVDGHRAAPASPTGVVGIDVEELTCELEAAQAAPPPQAAPAEDAGRVAQLEAAVKEAAEREDAIRAELLNAQAEMARLKEVSPPPSDAGDPEQPDQSNVAAFDAQPISALGLEEKVEKKVKKAACETIGALRKRYLDDNEALRKESKLTKDELITLGMMLAGKAPSMSVAQTAQTSVAPAPGTAPSDVPAGHTDRPWAERYQATRAKVIRMTQADDAVKAMREKAAEENPDAVENGNLDLSKLPEETADKIRAEEGTYRVIRGQVIAGIWHCGLDPLAGTLDAALDKAGIDVTTLPSVE